MSYNKKGIIIKNLILVLVLDIKDSFFIFLEDIK